MKKDLGHLLKELCLKIWLNINIFWSVCDFLHYTTYNTSSQESDTIQSNGVFCVKRECNIVYDTKNKFSLPQGTYFLKWRLKQ